MSTNLIHTIILSLVFCTLFAGAEYFYHKLKVKVELTRKFVHIFSGLVTLSFPLLLSNHWYVLFLSICFFLIMVFSMRFNLLPSINGVDRMTMGCVLFPIIIYICFVLFQYTNQVMLYYLPILILAICDPVAALVGIRWPIGKFKTFGTTKTLSGSIGFFVVAMFISVPMLAETTEIGLPVLLLVSLFISAITAFVEAISHKGYDNLTIPATVIVSLLISNQYIF